MQNDTTVQNGMKQEDKFALEKIYISNGYHKIDISDVYYPMVILLPDVMRKDKNENIFSIFCILSSADLALLHSNQVEYVWTLNKGTTIEKPEEIVTISNTDNELGLDEGTKRRIITKEKYVPLAVELKKSKDIFQQSCKQAHFCIESIHKNGVFPAGEMSKIMDIITSSVARNPHALLCMRGLQSADEYTYFHSVNVSILASIFAQFLGYSPKEVWHIGYAGILHDIGKQEIPLVILNAERKLTDKEFEIMKLHPQLANKILNSGHSLVERVIEGVCGHHEKFNGSGYPNGLKGDEIHPYATILAMADVYDALTSARPYKHAYTPTKAIAIMYSQKGVSFSSEMVNHFINCFGIYPVGSLVYLSNNNPAIVYENNDNDLRNPKVLQLQRSFGTILTNQAKPIDLSTAKDALHIVSCEDAHVHDFDLHELLSNNLRAL